MGGRTGRLFLKIYLNGPRGLDYSGGREFFFWGAASISWRADKAKAPEYWG